MKNWYKKQTEEKKKQIRNRIKKYQIENPDKVKKWKRKSRIKNKEKDKIKRRIWRQKEENKIKIKKYHEKYNKDNKEKIKLIYEKSKMKHPEKYIARGMSRKIIIFNKCCEQCGSTLNLHKHHEDYSKPLDITILCQKCHIKSHRNKIMEILN